MSTVEGPEDSDSKSKWQRKEVRNPKTNNDNDATSKECVLRPKPASYKEHIHDSSHTRKPSCSAWWVLSCGMQYMGGAGKQVTIYWHREDFSQFKKQLSNEGPMWNRTGSCVLLRFLSASWFRTQVPLIKHIHPQTHLNACLRRHQHASACQHLSSTTKKQLFEVRTMGKKKDCQAHKIINK